MPRVTRGPPTRTRPPPEPVTRDAIAVGWAVFRRLQTCSSTFCGAHARVRSSCSLQVRCSPQPAASAQTPDRRDRRREVRLERRPAGVARRKDRGLRAGHGNEKKDDYETSIWIAATDGRTPPRRFTAGPRDQAPRFSPDGSLLAFVRVAEKDGKRQPPQLFLMRCRAATRGGHRSAQGRGRRDVLARWQDHHLHQHHHGGGHQAREEPRTSPRRSRT